MLRLGWQPPAPPVPPSSNLPPGSGSQGALADPSSQKIAGHPLSETGPEREADHKAALSPTLEGPGNPPLPETEKVNSANGASIKNITARIQQRLGNSPAPREGAAKPEESTESEAEDTDSEEDSAPVTKKRRVSKKPAAASVTKKAAHASPPKKLVDEKLALVKKQLPFPDKKKQPMHCGCITVFADLRRQTWRIKPGKGRRDEKHVRMGSEPRVAWNSVQLRAAEYLAASTE